MSQIPTTGGRVILITGGTAGIGKATAMELARIGSTVIIVGRDKSRGEAAVADIINGSGNGSIELILADLSSQKDIRELAHKFAERYKRLDVLINNVGGPYGHRRETVDGIEATLAINHLCAFLLTQLLLPLLQTSTPSRVVNVNSDAHRAIAKIDFEDLQTVRWRRGFLVYSQAKLASLMFTYELAERLAGNHVTVNALHPGLIDTELVKRFLSERLFPSQRYISTVTSFIARKLARLIYTFDDLGKAAHSCAYLSCSPEVEGVTGKYFNNDKQIVTSSPASYDKVAALRLWQVSCELTGCDEGAGYRTGRGSLRGEKLCETEKL